MKYMINKGEVVRILKIKLVDEFILLCYIKRAMEEVFFFCAIFERDIFSQNGIKKD